MRGSARHARQRNGAAGRVVDSAAAAAAQPLGELRRALCHVSRAQRRKQLRHRRRWRRRRLHGWSNDCCGDRRSHLRSCSHDRNAFVRHALVLAAQHPRACVVRGSCARRRRSSQRPRPAPALRLGRTAAGQAHGGRAITAGHDAAGQEARGHQKHARRPPAALQARQVKLAPAASEHGQLSPRPRCATRAKPAASRATEVVPSERCAAARPGLRARLPKGAGM